MIAAAFLLLAQISDPIVCTSLELAAPQPSEKVEKLLSDQSHERRWDYLKVSKDDREAKEEAKKAREQYEGALKEAQKAADGVGAAMANFSLARLSYEVHHKWPASYIEASTTACKAAGCGPELVGAMLSWASAVGAKDSSYARAVTVAFRVALEETKRRKAMAKELSSAISRDDEADRVLTQRSRAIAAQLLETEVDDAADRGDSVGAAAAATQWGEILTSLEMPAKAADAYSKAAPLWDEAQCRVKEVDVFLLWAGLTTPPANSDAQKNAPANAASDNLYRRSELLAQSLKIAERDSKCQYAINQVLSSRSYLWKQASPDEQARFLAVREALASKAVNPRELSEVADQAESLGNHDLARSLYLDLARSDCNPYDTSLYYAALARISQDAGNSVEAGEYRKQADLLRANLSTAESYASGYLRVGAREIRYSGLTSALGGASWARLYSETSSGWNPPGSYGWYGRTGAALGAAAGVSMSRSALGGLLGKAKKDAAKDGHRDDDSGDSNKGEHPGTEGGTPGEKPNLH